MKKRILIIIPNLGRGGAQRVFRQQLKYLSDSFEAIGCVFNWDGAFEEDKAANVVSLNVEGGVTWVDKTYHFVQRIIRLRELKRKNGIDISISHLEGADYVNLLSKDSDKVICWIHGTKKFDENIKGSLGLIRHRILMPFIYRRAQKIVTVSKGIQDEFKNSFKGIDGLLKIIYNGFDRDEIQARSLESVDEDFVRLTKTSKTIITHCRLSKQKNVMGLIYIFKELIKTIPLKLIIIGDGELRNELVRECKRVELKIWNCWKNSSWDGDCDVYFLGQLQNPFKYLRFASLYSLTSSWEGFPLALCEAMVCGIPVVASDCFTGPREILTTELNLPQPIDEPLHGKFGVLMPMVDFDNELTVKKWVRELQKILNDDQLSKRYVESGAERIKDFELKLSIEQTVQLIQETC